MILLLQEAAKPFFTNDWPGVLKLVASLFTVVVIPVVAVIWKVMQGPLQHEDEKLQMQISEAIKSGKAQLDGLGERVNRVDNACTKNGTTSDELRRRIDLIEGRLDTMKESLGEMREAAEHLERLTISRSSEIIDHFQRSTAEQVAAVNDLKVAVARAETKLDERTRAITNPSGV